MTTLHDIAFSWRDLEDRLIANGGEPSPEDEAQLAALDLAERDKVDGYAFTVKSLAAEIDHLKQTESEIAAKRQAKVKLRAWLLERMGGYMAERQTKRVEGKVYRFQDVPNGGKPPVLVLVDADLLPEAYRKVSYAPDKEALRAGIEAGVPEVLAVAEIGEVGSSVRIY